MKLIKTPLLVVFIAAIFYCFFVPQLAGCKKETITETIKDTTYYDAVCPLRGIYSGTSTPNTGSPAAMHYTFQDNNFAIGTTTPGGTGVTFGGFRNTCDSVIISAYYTVNSSYYILKGKFSNNRNTISGTFNNLTIPSNFGTFTISK